MKKYHYSNNNHSTGGVGILGILQIIFIVLKCTNLIDWTWTQVFIPTFIGGALLALAVVVLFIILWRENK
jgi:hypothetical protein